MPFAVTWMDLEIIILSEIRQRKAGMISQVESNKNYAKEIIYKTETNSQILKSKLWLPEGKPWGERDALRVRE